MIQMQDVAYSYGQGRGDLLAGVTLSLPPGSFHFLTGPSGSGKTTLLKLCYAELLPTSGEMSLFEKDSKGLGRDQIALLRRKVGVVHQDCQFLDHLSVAENVALPLTVSGQSMDDAGLKQLLAWVGLSRLADALPPQLSGGERQRLALARAVVLSPDLILADEPTGNLDWEMSMRLLTLLIELNKTGKAVMIATHDLNLIRAAKQQVAARVLRISNRQLTLAGADL